jgi:dienelactone hydrolase
MADVDILKDYALFDFDDGRWVRPVFRKGSGPAVIVIHEMPGLHPLVVRFADRIAEAGMTVYLPSLFGSPGKPVSRGYMIGEIVKALCIRREFTVWAANASSPIVDWLRALARRAHADCGGRGVGAVGMCFTGNFALAMMTEPAVTAPVMSQPSLPVGKKNAAALGLSPDEIACAKQRFEAEDLSVIGLRFHGDPGVPPERFQTLRDTFGDRFEGYEFDPKDGRQTPEMRPHSVLTVHLKDDDPDGPTKRAEQRVIAFFKERTAL